MKIINSITDLKRIVTDATGSDYWTENAEDHTDASMTIARELSSRAHDSGFTYGEDWAEWLEENFNTEIGQKILGQ